MRGVDDFARRLLEEAKRFHEKARDEADGEGKQAYLHAAIMLGCCSLEAHINSIADDFLVRPELSILERSILAEREHRLENGEFVLTDILKMYRLTERIEFLYRRFSGGELDKTQAWWGQLKAALNTRNELSHPKQHTLVTEQCVDQALRSILDALNAIYQGIYRKPYPAHKRALNSKLTF
jgi:hypothetical protein